MDAPDSIPQTRFPLGEVIGTLGVLQLMARLEPGTISGLLRRHASGDWGDLDTHDALLNDYAIPLSERLQSVYVLPTGETIWIATEHDRSRTTIMLPEEA